MDLLEQNDMVGEISPDECWLAEDAGQLLGFARIEIFEGKAYVRPIVVASQCQGLGVGRLLMARLLTEYPDLGVVTRGHVAGFYRRLGFRPIAWAEVAPILQRECDLCPDVQLCNPVPMRYKSGVDFS
jgi:N-acetylglutamate synthase-like GNAT family acetyltransferase